MRRVFEPVEVDEKKGWPCRIRWRGTVLRVKRPLDFWKRRGRWWGKEEERIYFRLLTDGGAIEIYRDGSSDWVLTKVLD